jgi:hypothetical protein
MSKQNPFAAALEILSRHVYRDIAEASMVRQAMNVLETAGKVDPSALETFMEMVCEPRDIWEEARVKEIRALLSALPDKESR